ncbi:MAG: ankyrin repeat domain-containing protein [Gammaproteobacteria bacterium]
MRHFLLLRGATFVALSLILASCGGGAREVEVREQEAGYYTEVREDLDPEFLCEAAKNGNSREARFLLDNGADPNALCHTEGLYVKSACTVFGVGLMITAPLVGRCWEPDMPPILFAAKGGHADVMRALLEHGANPQASKGIVVVYALKAARRIVPVTPLRAVIGNAEMARMLLAHGVPPDADSLLLAVKSNSHEVVQMLLDCGANPGAGDIKGVLNAWDFARDNPVILGILDRYLEEAKAGEWEKSCPQKEKV